MDCRKLGESEFKTLVKNDRREIFHPGATAPMFDDNLATNFEDGLIKSKIKEKTFVEHLLNTHVQVDKFNVDNLIRKVNILLERRAPFTIPDFKEALEKIVQSGVDNENVLGNFFSRVIRNNVGTERFQAACDAFAEVAAKSVPDQMVQEQKSFVANLLGIFISSCKSLQRNYDVDTQIFISIFNAVQNSECSKTIKECMVGVQEITFQKPNTTFSCLNDHNGCNLLHMAVILDSAALCRYVCDRDVVTQMVNQSDKFGRTPVFYCWSKEVLSVLMSVPTLSFESLKDNDELTLVHYLLQAFRHNEAHGYLDVLHLLAQNPAVDVLDINNSGDTLFISLLKCGKSVSKHRDKICNILEVLLDRADFSLQDINKAVVDTICQQKIFCIFSLLARKNYIGKIALSTSCNNLPLVHQVALEGDIHDFTSLLSHPNIGDHINKFDGQQKSVLFHTIHRRLDDKTCALLDVKGLHVNIQDVKGNSILHQLASEKVFSKEGLERLLSSKSLDVNKLNYDGQTSLHTAAVVDNRDFIEILISKCSERIDVDHKDKSGKTAVLMAMEKSHLEFLGILLNSNIRFTKGETLGKALITAVKWQSQELVKLLVGHQDLEVNFKDEKGRTPLHMVTNIHHRDNCIMQILLGHQHINLSLQDNDGNTPLMNGVKVLPPEEFRTLIEHPTADVHLKNSFHQTLKDIYLDIPESERNTKVGTLIAQHIEKPAPQMYLNSNSVSIKDAIYILKQSVANEINLNSKEKEEMSLHIDYVEKFYKNITHGRRIFNTGMSDEHKRLLIEHRMLLVDEIEPRDLTDYLMSKEVISEHQYEEIHSFVTRRLRVQSLLLILPRCGPNAFEAFIEALKHANQDYVAQAMLDTSQESREIIASRTKDEALFGLLSSLSECTLLFAGNQAAGGDSPRRKSLLQ